MATLKVFAGAGDGTLFTGLASWAINHDATSSTVSTIDSDNQFVQIYTTNGSNWYFRRGNMPFDTSGLPVGASISGATIDLYVSSKTNTVDTSGNDYIGVVKSLVASDTTLTGTDYNDIGYDSGNEGTDRAKYTPQVQGATALNLGSITAGAYNTWTLNTTGRGWIDDSGYSKFGFREGHDILDTEPSASSGQFNRINIRYSEYSGETSDPFIEITYTEVASSFIPKTIII